MSRRLPAILISTVLGALTTLAVAWACAAWINPNRAPYTFAAIAGPNNTWMGESIQHRFGHTRINRATLINFQRDPTTGAIQSIGVSGGDRNASSVDLTGWPFRAMRCDNNAEITIGNGSAILQSTTSGIARSVGLLELSRWSSSSRISTWRALPDRPMWPGFAVDTVVYAAAWWLIIFGWRRYRRARRVKRGLCPRCAYDLRGQTAGQLLCPECGWCPKPPPT